MASDWAFYFLIQPLGIAAIAVAIGLAFILWRLLLGRIYNSIGSRPLLAGYTAAFGALTAYTFVTSYFEFTHRVETGLLSESERWATVHGWTVYMSVLSLVVVLPVLFVFGTPTAALLTRLRRLTAAQHRRCHYRGLDRPNSAHMVVSFKHLALDASPRVVLPDPSRIWPRSLRCRHRVLRGNLSFC